LIFDGAVSAANSLTANRSSSRPLSSARIAVRIFVVLAGGSGSSGFRAQMVSPLAASITSAARAVSRGAAPARPGANARPASTTSAAIPPGARPLPIAWRSRSIW